jgi:alpha-1,3-glucosyltransferase
MLGLSLLSFAFMADKKPMLASFSFCCALMFKQMALFYALPVFFFLLGTCVQAGFVNGYYQLMTARYV